jgi:hypothetical protein
MRPGCDPRARTGSPTLTVCRRSHTVAQSCRAPRAGLEPATRGFWKAARQPSRRAKRGPGCDADETSVSADYLPNAVIGAPERVRVPPSRSRRCGPPPRRGRPGRYPPRGDASPRNGGSRAARSRVARSRAPARPPAGGARLGPAPGGSRPTLPVLGTRRRGTAEASTCGRRKVARVRPVSPFRGRSRGIRRR